ncbi:hypothetical protein BRARA_H02512 [Brassica rapa]|uniref:Uncharacterized protein n=1 Tax=Brassica campestris TaxID=3711 RepID=A0A397YEI7_BRACM|nr:hypothetical protein BRARA_H02512 [Brassica rapa]
MSSVSDTKRTHFVFVFHPTASLFLLDVLETHLVSHTLHIFPSPCCCKHVRRQDVNRIILWFKLREMFRCSSPTVQISMDFAGN